MRVRVERVGEGHRLVGDGADTLKRSYGWDRTRLDGPEGAQIWTGQAVLAHNLIKIGAPAS